ncbi:glycine--tRNA ligase subunit beta [Paucibacter sp. XJ19-41]|uniref:glycine--tRNA ligase subunit beta n=1 Tax=Paucibacter sp. XJ19-41 TaxID=2927824 RepID=UPI00234B4D1C|nr:glycine--tRNA ligase subunit beta [Paucibacter sp. XJ19-41]MDC6167306.1 glycine--tRNA ligase subunit beta [Paucibacter sp. XJ19-41]
MTTAVKNLLIELFVEELPPKALKKLGEAFAAVLVDSLKAQGLVGEGAQATAIATPRRLGLHLTDVAPKAADRAVQQKLMPVAVALTAEGQATPALLKKLAGVGADASVLPLLKRLPDESGKGKTEALFLDQLVPGATLAEGLQKALDESLAKLPIPKVMTYQLKDGWTDVKFVRPAHGIVALHGADLVAVSALGLQSGRTTRGHRFEASAPELTIESADSYAAQMREQGAVIAGFAERRAEIVRQLQAAAGGLTPIDDEDLLDEVTALVERPHVLACQFEPEFLAVPQECLILTMKANQKYFPLLDAAGKLTNHFLVVSAISPADASAVVQGNERVVRPRLADAKFFFDQDRKKSLAERVPGLAKVVYHGKLGTQGERRERVEKIAQAISEQLGRRNDGEVYQAAHLAKADLLTDMVGEFPELQGIMGGYYARHDGLNEAVAVAIEDHYKPRFAGDALPRNDVGLIVALADKLETLVGLFGIGQLPTGDKDPFALRRHALGVIRILVEANLPLDLGAMLSTAVGGSDQLGFAEGSVSVYWTRQEGGTTVPIPINPDTPLLLSDFIFDRLAGSLREQGYSAQEVDAVLALRPQRLADVGQRLAAVRAFAALPEAASLAAANKRIGNILKKSETAVDARIDAALLQEAAEQQLAAALDGVAPKADALFQQGEYAASLRELAALKAPVDAFFDGVMVNAEDPALRANRLGLLKTLHEAMNRVADLSRLAS